MSSIQQHPLALPPSLASDHDDTAMSEIDSPSHDSPRKPSWDSLNWQAKLKEKAWWLICFLTVQSKFESIIYSLSIGLMTSAALIFILSYFSPLALVIVTGLTISALTTRLLWSIKKNVDIKQKFLFLAVALIAGALFFICINFAAIPTAGIAVSLSGGGFMIAAANAAIYLTIFLGLTQLTLSSIKHWQTTHKLNSESSLQIAHTTLSATSLTTEKRKAAYTSSQKFYLIYKGTAALALSIAMGALSYYGLTHLLPIAFLSLGISLSPSILTPIAISLFVITSLIISKQLLAHVIKQVEEKEADPPSLLQELLNRYRNIRFNQEPAVKIRLTLTALWQATFSYEVYQAYSVKYKRLHLTKAEFKIRNGVLILFLPLTLIALALKPFLNKEYKLSLSKDLEGQFFWRSPLRFCLKFLILSWKYFFSYANYQKINQTNPALLTQKQFYWRNCISVILFPLLIVGSALSLYTSSIGLAQLTSAFKLSENLALGLTGLTDAFLASISNLSLFSKSSLQSEQPKDEHVTKISPSQRPPSVVITQLRGGVPPHHRSISRIQATIHNRRFTPPVPAKLSKNGISLSSII